MKKVKFDVSGMTCSACQNHVEKAVSKLDGVQNVSVNLLSNNMIVEFNENNLDTSNIIEAVVDAGYGAKVFSNEKNKEVKKQNKDDEIKSMRNRLIISICFLIPLMYIAMHHMLYEWFGIPVPQIVKKLLHGTENAVLFSLSQFLLLLPIVYVNRNYFIVGFKRLFKRSPNMDSLIAIGSSAAIIYGIYAIFSIGYGLGHNRNDLVEKFIEDIYFESAGTILTLVTVR